jgi:hypothetical protein
METPEAQKQQQEMAAFMNVREQFAEARDSVC